jgi:hypothetical protein
MPKRLNKSISPASAKRGFHPAPDGEIILASRKTIVTNGIVSIEVPYIRIPHVPSWDDQELGEAYASGAH